MVQLFPRNNIRPKYYEPDFIKRIQHLEISLDLRILTSNSDENGFSDLDNQSKIALQPFYGNEIAREYCVVTIPIDTASSSPWTLYHNLMKLLRGMTGFRRIRIDLYTVDDKTSEKSFLRALEDYLCWEFEVSFGPSIVVTPEQSAGRRLILDFDPGVHHSTA